ncbi:MAG: histidine--tRNA ligase [bacterium]
MSEEKQPKKQKLSTESYKGVRDFYPEDMAIEKYIFEIWRKTAESFGYIEYGASILEPTELYKAKSGEEIVNEQTYSFKDRGDRDVTIRPEMTPTVARMIAGIRREAKFPLRWYSIPNLFRYERPQRGRLREHFQLNCDIFGLEGIEAEVEMLSLSYQIMKNFGLKDEQFEIRINSRELLTETLTKQGIAPEKISDVIRLIDKKNKLKDFDEQYKSLTGKEFNLTLSANTKIDSLIEKLSKKNIHVIFDPSLARGFDYYTGIVFEIYDKNPANPRALFGGGRYDNLLDIFDVEKVPTVGFGMGDVTIKDVLETYGLLPEYKSTTQVAILPFSDEFYAEADIVANEFRIHNINVVIDYSNKKIGDRIAKIDKEKIPYVLVVGEEENKTKKFKLKELSTKKESEITLADIKNLVWKKI